MTFFLYDRVKHFDLTDFFTSFIKTIAHNLLVNAFSVDRRFIVFNFLWCVPNFIFGPHFVGAVLWITVGNNEMDCSSERKVAVFSREC